MSLLDLYLAWDVTDIVEILPFKGGLQVICRVLEGNTELPQPIVLYV